MKHFRLQLKKNLSSNESKISHNPQKKLPTPDDYDEAFEKLACQAFLKIRQNADIFINLLVLMLVAGLDELDL